MRMDRNSCKGFFFSFKFTGTEDLFTKREKGRKNNRVSHFEDFKAFYLVASIFKYSSTSSIRVSSLFFIVPYVSF